LYFVDQAVEENSLPKLLLSTVALYLALVTHYSALIVALTLALYGFLRLVARRAPFRTVFLWVATQLGALALIAFLLVRHLSRIRASGLAETIANSYLRRSVLQAGQNPLGFVARGNLRLFHYFFSQGAVGALAWALFLYGVFLLVKAPRASSRANSASPQQIAFLLVFPVVVNCLLGLARLYPFGGTRHNSYLAIFAIPAIATPIARASRRRKWLTPLAIGLTLAACNLFPSPQGEYIRARDQNRKLMARAMAALSSLPSGSTILTDDQGGLLLSYYLCQAKVAQIEQQPFQLFLHSRCGDHWVLSLDPELWIFKAETFPALLDTVQRSYNFAPGTELWFFQAGWFVDQEYALRDELRRMGCFPQQEFGRNMLDCRLSIGGPGRANLPDLTSRNTLSRGKPWG
jgi:hypothetical protein